MLLWGSFTLIILIIGLVVCYSYIRRKYISSMVGMVISMTNSMLASIALGTILGIIIQDKDLTLPTIVSVSFGIIVGYITGRPVSLIASLEGITAGIMGGMMGAMLGVMTQQRTSELLVSFIDIVYLSVSIMLFRVIEEESFQKGPYKKKLLLVNFLVLIVIVIFVIFLVNFNLNIFLN